MRSIIKKAAIVLLVLGGFSLFANEGTVTYLKGKAEVHRNDSWIQLKLGDSVYNSDVISTGFQSEVKIKVMDSVLSLGPVTRISLQELSSTQEKDKINIYLNTGTIRTKVNHTDNKRVSCQVRTPIGVASVRGTDFSVDDSNTISVFEGKVAVITNSAIASQNNTDTYGNVQNDFEDSVQYSVAMISQMDGIVTRNLNDYKKSEIPIWLPNQIEALFRSHEVPETKNDTKNSE